MITKTIYRALILISLSTSGCDITVFESNPYIVLKEEKNSFRLFLKIIPESGVQEIRPQITIKQSEYQMQNAGNRLWFYRGTAPDETIATFHFDVEWDYRWIFPPYSKTKTKRIPQEGEKEILINRFTFFGENEADGLGMLNNGTGDINGDGYNDFIIGTWSYYSDFSYPNSNPAKGCILVYSGRQGTLLYKKDGDNNGDRFGRQSSILGDVNNDGFDDFAAGSSDWNSQTGYVNIYSGSDGSLLYRKEGPGIFTMFGYRISPTGDLDNDNFDDFMIAGRNDQVYVFSGQNGNLIKTLSGSYSGFYAEGIAGGVDINNDGYPDLLVKDGNATYGDNEGRIIVYYGPDLNSTDTIRILDLQNPAYFGDALSFIGDINGDAYNDILVGYTYQDAGFVRAFSGKDLTEIYTYRPSDRLTLNNLVSISDIDGDEVDDIIIGTSLSRRIDNGFFKTGVVSLISGSNGNEIISVEPQEIGTWDHQYPDGYGPGYFSPRQSFGRQLASLGDLNNDNIPDFAIGATTYLHNNQNWAGAAYIFYNKNW